MIQEQERPTLMELNIFDLRSRPVRMHISVHHTTLVQLSPEKKIWNPFSSLLTSSHWISLSLRVSLSLLHVTIFLLPHIALLRSKEVKLWGGRFEESVTDKVEKFTESISFDKGLITDNDRDNILRGLNEIERKIEADKFEWRTDREDVHMNIEAALADLICEPAEC